MQRAPSNPNLTLIAGLVVFAAGCTAPPAEEAWQLPGITAGTVVDYQAGNQAITFEIRNGGPFLRADGSSVEGYEITSGTKFWQVDRGYQTLTVGSTCWIANNVDGEKECTLWRHLNWGDIQGAMWGATFLQGRVIRLGDHWEIPGCCGGQRSVTITGPTDLSPPGTAFVADIHIEDSPMIAVAHHGPSVIHMSSSSPYPLLAQTRGPEGEAPPWEIAAVRTGVDLGAAPLGIDVFSSLTSSPWSNGLPPEGQPPQGVPSLSSALGGASDPSIGSLTYLAYGAETSPTRIGPVTYNETDFTYTLTDAADPAGGHRLTMHRISGPTNVDSSWTDTPLGPTTAAPLSCPASTVPVWDVARRAEAAGVMHQALKYEILPPCLLRIFGNAPDMPDPHFGPGFGHLETFDFDLALGRFVSAQVYFDRS